MSEEKLVNFHLNAELYHELKMLAVRENRSIKEILNEQIEKYCQVHKEGNPQHLLDKFTENEDFIGFPAIGIEFKNKKNYILKNCQKDNRINIFGNELLGHVTQWYVELMKL